MEQSGTNYALTIHMKKTNFFAKIVHNQMHISLFYIPRLFLPKFCLQRENIPNIEGFYISLEDAWIIRKII